MMDRSSYWNRRTRLPLTDAEALAALHRAAADKDGLALVRAVLRSPAGGRIALVSSFGAESAVLLDMVATVAPATPVICLDTGRLFAETLAHQQALCALLGLTDVRHLRPEPAALAAYRLDHRPQALSGRDPR